jgi:hypothetical protein
LREQGTGFVYRELIHPSSVVVSQGEVYIAEAVTSPIGRSIRDNNGGHELKGENAKTNPNLTFTPPVLVVSQGEVYCILRRL